MLELQNLNVYYGAIHALKNLNLKINQGEIVTLIGANGAGKTTTLRTISGIEKAKSGIKTVPQYCWSSRMQTWPFNVPIGLI